MAASARAFVVCPRHPCVTVLAALLGVLTVVGCATVPTAVGMPTATTPAATVPLTPAATVPLTPAATLPPTVAGRTWTLQGFAVFGRQYRPVPGAPVTLRLQDWPPDASGFGGCDAYAGTYTTAGDARPTATGILFGLPLHLRVARPTHQACSAPRNSVEQAYLDALQGVEAYGLVHGTLELVGGDYLIQVAFA